MFTLVINKELNSLDAYDRNGSRLFKCFNTYEAAQSYFKATPGGRNREVVLMLQKFKNYSQKAPKVALSLSQYKGKSVKELNGVRVVNPQTGATFQLGSTRGRLQGWVRQLLTENGIQ
jgi:hypothetical protein